MPAFLSHHYGTQFHLIHDVYLQTLLTQLCQPRTQQPHINHLVQQLYGGLVRAAAETLFPQKSLTTQTRMQAPLTAQIYDPQTQAVTVNLARAGTYPSHICYEFMHWFLPPENIRQDHIFAARLTNQKDQVTGTHLGSYKIGGSIADRFVIFPDPMGATGGTILSAIDYYQNQVSGPAKEYIALHLIVTPEYLQKVLSHPAQIKVFALRVDRGMSPNHVLNSPLGLYWDQEKGLNDKQYIVPGAGGLGELLNNSFV
jgi:uracil phosphoribosyltransferase